MWLKLLLCGLLALAIHATETYICKYTNEDTYACEKIPDQPQEIKEDTDEYIPSW